MQERSRLTRKHKDTALYDRRSYSVACRGAAGSGVAQKVLLSAWRARARPESALRADGQVTLRDHLSHERHPQRIAFSRDTPRCPEVAPC